MKLKVITILSLTGLMFACTETIEVEENGMKESSLPTEVTNDEIDELLKEGDALVSKKADNSASNVTPKSEYTSFLTDDEINSLGKSLYADMYNAGGPDKIEVKVVKFAPPGWDHDLAYCHIKYFKGEVRQQGAIVFKPNDAGVLSSDNMGWVAKEDAPCNICEVESIKNEKLGEYEEVVGTFVDIVDGSKIRKKMDYNLEEMSIYWMDIK
jgi:hypothetical protein